MNLPIEQESQRTVINRLRDTFHQYPRQFWLLFVGMLVSTVGSSMVWPFLTIYLSKRLDLPLLTITSLFTINAIAELAFSFIAGPIVDRVGRKWVMVISLVLNGLINIAMSQAASLPAFALLMGLTGAVNPLYRIGADAMMADLIPPEKRPEGYSLMRMANNLGISIGPILGGVVTTSSYTIAYLIAASGLVFYGMLLTFLAKETKPVGEKVVQRQAFGGYNLVLKDRTFLSFVGAIALNTTCAAMMWLLMSVYANTNFAVPERLYGFIPTTNALMVVLFQYLVTKVTRRFPTFWMLGLGALVYALAAGSVALATGFWGFWVSMVIMTIGELILVPTATTWVANRAPADMRGRYMGIYGLTWGIARGIGPSYGGFMNDTFGPPFIWYGSFVIGLISVVWFALIMRRRSSTINQGQAV